jgi:hypothetical protein
MASSGQYSQSKLSVMKPDFSPFVILRAPSSSSSKVWGGRVIPASAVMVLL